MRLSNKTLEEHQKQSRQELNFVFFLEKAESTSKNNCYELKLPTIFLYFLLAIFH